MDINKREKLRKKLPVEFNKLVNCFLFINNRVITKDNLCEILDYHLFSKGIAIYYCDVKNKNNSNVLGFTAEKIKQLNPNSLLESFEKGIFYNSLISK